MLKVEKKNGGETLRLNSSYEWDRLLKVELYRC